MTKRRQNWDKYFVEIARQVATRSTCDRRHVGCVIVRDKYVLTTGYNGSLPGEYHCNDVGDLNRGHIVVDGHCVRTIHAETNAILHAAKHGVPLEGATCYTTTKPCWECFKNLVSVGIDRIFYCEEYESATNDLVLQYLVSHPDFQFNVI